MNVCAVDGCPRPVKIKSSGWCHTHYMRWYRHRDISTPANAKRPRHIPFEQWFWSYFQPNGECLDWMRGTVDGYGHVRYGERMRKTHVVAWILTNGPIPGGLHVLHSCDRPICGNQAHLFLGTNNDNIRDKVSKGRWRGNPERDALGRFSST